MLEHLGKLTFQFANYTQSLLGAPVFTFLQKHGYDGVWVSEIDTKLADTAAFCEQYDIGLDISANCVIVEARRGDKTWYGACVILATTKADINGVIRKALDARKTSFAPMDRATSLTRMEYGGITPIGLPGDWPIFIDSQVIRHEKLILGSGIRGSKILVTSTRLQQLPNVKVMDIAKHTG